MRENNIPLKTSIDVIHQKKACRLAERIIKEVKNRICAGVSTGEINTFCEEKILELGGQPALKGYRGFPAAVCTSVNNVAAHGMPGEYVLKEGDLITLDLTVKLHGWHGDIAWTFCVGEADADSRRLIKAAWQATMAGIQAAKAGNRLGDIGHAVKQVADTYGCSVLEDLVGHGIGRDLHEEPIVLHFGAEGTGLPVVPGMVLTVEPILALGSKEMKRLGDGWSILTEDNSKTAQYEHTIAVFGSRTEVLTLLENSEDRHIDFPPFF